MRLRAEGHQVALATHGLFENLVHGLGLGFHALPLNTGEELAATGTGGQWRTTLAVNRIVAGHARAMGEAMVAAARQADVLLLSPAGWIGGHVAEGLGLPSMGVYLQPLTPTREFPPSTVTARSLGGWGNHRAATMLRAAGQQPFRAAVGELRHGLGLPPVRPGAWLAGLEAARWPICYGYSPVVVPQPAAGLRAGVPVVPVPSMVDQPLWARRLELLGVTPGGIAMRRLTGDRLAAALTAAVGDPRYRERAAVVAGRLAREDGAAGVLRVLEQVASR